MVARILLFLLRMNDINDISKRHVPACGFLKETYKKFYNGFGFSTLGQWRALSFHLGFGSNSSQIGFRIYGA